jgi:hypothetical protein
MNRRDLLRAGAAATAGGLATAAGLAVGSEPADAQASTTLDVAGDSVVLDGSSIAAVRLTLDVDWSYDLPADRQPESVTVEIAAGPSDGQLTPVADAESAQLFVEASGSESFDVGLLSEGALDAESLTPDSGSRATDVTVEATFEVANGSGTVLARDTATDTATLDVTKESIDPNEYGSVGGSGALSIELE